MKVCAYLLLTTTLAQSLSLASGQQNGQQKSQPFRTQLFPEQLQQQQLQFRQVEIQAEIQNLQKLVQVWKYNLRIIKLCMLVLYLCECGDVNGGLFRDEKAYDN